MFYLRFGATKQSLGNEWDDIEQFLLPFVERFEQ